MRVESPIALMMSLVITLHCTAAAPVIGIAVANGAFRLDDATVLGNATLLEGALIETNLASSRLEMSKGSRILLGAKSKARLYGDHMILQKGEAHLEPASNFLFEAAGLIIQPESGGASARVSLVSEARVEVAALSGSFRVLNNRGLLVAHVAASRAIVLEPQAGATTTRVTGTLRQVSGHYLLTDETTNVTVELTGPGLLKEVGSRVEITGLMDPAGVPVAAASQVIRATSITHLGTAAAAAGRGGASGGRRSGVPISLTTIAIIGGVAAAATIGGLAAAGKLTGSTTTSVSR